MTFIIFGCILDTDLILVSILTNSRSLILKKNKISHVTSTFDLQSQGHADNVVTFFSFGCILDID